MEQELHKAAQRGEIERLKELLAGGADANAPRESDGRTPLMCACAADVKDAQALEAVNVLLAAGADVESKDQQGFTPLMHSIKAYNMAALRQLLEVGANVNAQNAKGGTALNVARDISFWERRSEAIRLLQDRGAKFVRKYMWSDTGEDRRTLAEATRDEDVETVRLLLRRGPSQVEKDQALEEAAGTGRMDIAQELLAAGADARSQGNCLYQAVMGDARVEMLQLLVAAGADPNRADAWSDRRTSLWWAQHFKHWEQVAFLEPLTARPTRLRDRYKGKFGLKAVENQWRAMLLVRAGIDAVETALVKTLPEATIARDVAGKMADLPQWCLLAFQLKTHEWTCVVALSSSTEVDTDAMAKELAALCRVEAMSYDTGEDSDRRLTLFSAGGEEVEFLGYAAADQGTFVARSRERDLSSEDPVSEAEENRLLNSLLKPRRALIPPVGCQIAQGGQPYHLGAIEIGAHEVVRMDVIGFRGEGL
jgi:ankyrin repeat protein